MEIQRNTFFDSLKFYLIFLVILGHMLGKYIDIHSNLVARNFIYLFHMPLFIFISGYFSKSRDKKKLKKGIFKILETYLIIQLVNWSYLLYTDSLEIIKMLIPWWISWYLLSLIFWKIITFYTTTLFSKNIVIISSIIIAMIVGFLPFVGYPLSLSRTLVFLPFFLIGYYSQEVDILKIRSIKKLYSIIILLTILLVTYFINFKLHNIVSGANPYNIFSNSLVGFSGRFLFISIGFIMSAMFINILPNIKFFSKIGQNTLLYYVYHAYIIIAFEIIISKLNIQATLPINILLSILCVVIIYYFSKLKISTIILNPITYYLERRNSKIY